MSRFQDYLSSAITPQMTLLEKFNALIKFLKENNFISVFYSSQNYNPNTLNYNISNVSTLGYELKLGDCIIFSNGYYAFVETIGEITFTIGNILYFQGEQGVSVVSATINNSGNLILTLSNGTTINAGNTGAVKDFIIDVNQHLIVRYLNGTQNDLGNIFNGDLNLNGDLTANSIIENMNGYSFNKPNDTENITRNYKYAGVVKNGNKITFVIFAEINILNNISAGTGITMGTFTIPLLVGNKIYPYTIGSLENVVAGGKNTLISDLYSGEDIYAYYRKTSAININGLFYKSSALTAGSKFLFRLEATFLLSENLAV